MKKLISKIAALAACTGILLSSQTAAYAETISVDPDYPIHGNKCGIIYVDPSVDRDVYVTITQYTPDGDYVYYNTIIPAAGNAAGENDYSFLIEGKDDVSYDIVIGVPKFKSSKDPQIYTYKFSIRDTDDIVDEIINGYSFYFSVMGSKELDTPALLSSTPMAKNEDNIMLATLEIGFPLADYIRGDVNFNNKIDLQDIIEVAKQIMHNDYLSGDKLLAADFDENGTVNLNDVIGLSKYYLKNNK